MLEGFEDFAFLDEVEDKQEKTKRDAENIYEPLSYEKLHFLSDGPKKCAPGIIHNDKLCRMDYKFATDDINGCLEDITQFKETQNMSKVNRTVLSQLQGLQARCFVEQDRFEEACELYKKITKTCGHQDSDGWMMYSLCLLMCGKVTQGLEIFQKAIYLRPGHPAVWTLYAKLLNGISDTPCSALSNIDAESSFNLKWRTVLTKIDNSNVEYSKDKLQFQILCATYNSHKLNCEIFDNHSSKEYSILKMGNTFDSENLVKVINSFDEVDLELARDNFNVIHYENWDGTVMDLTIDFDTTFFKRLPVRLQNVTNLLN